MRRPGRLLKVHYKKFTVMRGVEHTVLLFFNYVSKITIINQIISSHKMIYNFLVLVDIKSFIPFLNPNIKIFTIETLVYLVEMRLEWLDISWGFTETCRCGKLFKTLYCLMNSSVFLIITYSQKQLGTFKTIIHGKGAM